MSSRAENIIKSFMACWGPFNLIPFPPKPRTHKTQNISSRTHAAVFSPRLRKTTQFRDITSLNSWGDFIFLLISLHMSNVLRVYIRNCTALAYLPSNDIRNGNAKTHLFRCRLSLQRRVTLRSAFHLENPARKRKKKGKEFHISEMLNSVNSVSSNNTRFTVPALRPLSLRFLSCLKFHAIIKPEEEGKKGF